MKVMISQPMRGRKEEDIKKEREDIIEKFNKLHIEVVDTMFTDDPTETLKDINMGVYWLSKSIEALSKVDALYMCSGWQQARGCRIEREIASQYGIKILEDNFLEPNTVNVARVVGNN